MAITRTLVITIARLAYGTFTLFMMIVGWAQLINQINNRAFGGIGTNTWTTQRQNHCTPKSERLGLPYGPSKRLVIYWL